MPSIEPHKNAPLAIEAIALAAGKLREYQDAAELMRRCVANGQRDLGAADAAAKALAERVRESVRREALSGGAGVVPAGSPGRSQARPRCRHLIPAQRRRWRPQADAPIQSPCPAKVGH